MALLTDMFHLLRSKTSPEKPFEECRDEPGLHSFLQQASERYIGLLTIRHNPRLSDILPMIEYHIPNRGELSSLSEIPVKRLGTHTIDLPEVDDAPPPALHVPAEDVDEVEEGEVHEEEQEVMDVDEEGEVLPTPPPEVVDLTQEDREEGEEGEDQDVVLLDAPIEQPDVQQASAQIVHQEAPPVPEQAGPSLDGAPTSEKLTSPPPIQADEEDATMRDATSDDAPNSKPLTQTSCETLVERMMAAAAAATAEPPAPISRTTSGQYSLTSVPPSVLFSPSYTFAAESAAEPSPQEQPKPHTPDLSCSATINGRYTLPPLNALPPEFQRKSKSSRQSRKREKEKAGDGKGPEWVPMGANKWGATIRSNPVYKRISKATKCLSTHDWNIAITELRLLRTLERVEQLKDAGRWSFRQPKKQRGVGGLTKTHWDYLLDEMKWMRTDFREERRWKIALAYTLAHAVMEWHEAGTLEERVARGICVLWRRPKDDEVAKDELPEELPAVADDGGDAMITNGDEDDDGEDSKQTSTPGDDGSDDESEEEQEKEQQDVLDVLDPSQALQDELNRTQESQEDSSQEVQPKVEDVEDLSALRDKAMDVDPQSSTNAAVSGTDSSANVTGLKDTSSDPLLAVTAPPVPPPAAPPKTPVKQKVKASTYAPLREQIAYSNLDTLFVDVDDLDLVRSMSELSTDDSAIPPPPDFAAIFPDLHPFGMLDVAPLPGEGKRKSDRRADRDDPNKRLEDSTYSKLTPLNEMMYQKPTLLGALDPANHWEDGEWHGLEETAVAADLDWQGGRPVEESISSSGVFASTPRLGPSQHWHSIKPPNGLFSLLDSKISAQNSPQYRQRAAELGWTPQDDAILKRLTEKYPGNWILIAEAFNSHRVTIQTEKRTVADCYARFTRAFAAEEPPATPQATTMQMTTRGVKRSYSTAISGSSVNLSTPGGSQQVPPPKQRRRGLMQEALRRSSKKREAALKAQSAQRKPPQVHDTHAQYSKMPKYTPAELSRMKTEQDQRNQHDALLKSKRDEELRRQQTMQRLAATNGSPNGQNGAPRVAQANGVTPAQAVPQIRSQVNISQQQQRISSQMALQTARLNVASQQSLQNMQAQAQAQAQHARALAALQAQTQAQVAANQAQVQAQQPSMPTSMAANLAPALSSAHLSPPFVGRPTSASPGLPQQSPPILGSSSAGNATSPRPSAAQAQAHANQIAQQVSRNAATLQHYYQQPNTAGVATMLTPEQQAEQTQQIRALLQQQTYMQQQRQNAAAHQQNPYPQQ
ncbi:chromatin modification- protein VID21 [Steccherinum ochraceum]|uniref:Vacuolar import and degradation protein 21 n=1 Tax=Steccherinum ochraceum TaxID=92696 RepID=A0A4R0R6V3_9APHY|nr:chromatin modification- protein VID21 [Steccherinum ochraceum]